MRAEIFDDVEGFASALPPMRAIMGLDLGEKTIGVAMSDTFRSVATPLETVRRKKFGVDAERLLYLIAERNIAGIILGLPRNMDGSEGPRAQSARAFARNVSEKLDLPVALWDERLSTAAAERILLEADASRKRRAEVIDALAAQHILQGALNRLAMAARDAHER